MEHIHQGVYLHPRPDDRRKKKTHDEVNQAETNQSSHMKGPAPFFNIEM